MEFEILEIKNIPDELLNQIAKIYHENDIATADPRDTVLTSPEYHISVIKKYAEKERSAFIGCFIDGKLAATQFILNLNNSPYLNKNEELRNALKEENVEIDETYVPGYIIVVPEFRGNNLGEIVDKKTREVATELGYKHIITFGGQNDGIYDYYKHKYPDDGVNNKTLNVLDHNNKNISLYHL
jgi:hypothetical protein